MQNDIQHKPETLEPGRHIEALRNVLTMCNDTVMDLFHSLNYAGEYDRQAEPRVIAELVDNLENQLQAAHSLACVAPRRGNGWPDEQEALATLTGERSGYPIDLVTSCLDKARGCCGLANQVMSNGSTPNHSVMKPDGSLTAAIWGIQTQIMTVMNIIDYKPATPAQAAA